MHQNQSPHWRQRRAMESLAARWGGVADQELAGLVAPPPRRPVPARLYTAHLGFEATGSTQARERAIEYAEALSLLRPELALGAAAVSPAEAWHRAEPLFCGAPGPDGERCADVFGHPGFHHGPGIGSLGWGDGDADPGR